MERGAGRGVGPTWRGVGPAWSGLRPAALPLALALAAASPAAAQNRRVLLEVRPRAGDTIRMRLDQQVEMSGTARVRGVDSTMSVTTAMKLHTRCVVQGSDPTGTTVLATTDSLWITSDGERPAEIERARRAILGRSVRLHLAPDGAAAVVDGDATPPELRDLFAQMPATLPPRPVAPGESWTRTMDIPRAGAAGAGGTLAAVFHLDSLSRGGDVAYVSMRGTLSRPPAAPDGLRGGAARSDAPPPTADALRGDMSGTVAGTMVIDRRRRWMTDARTTLVVRVLIRPRAAAPSAEPTRVLMKMTQWLRTY